MAKRSDIPVARRLYHWINLISITALAISGWYIHSPFSTASISMGTMRTIHFLFMWVFTVNVVLRIYWAFFGKGGDWKSYLAQRWFSGEVWKATIRHYVLYEHFPKGMKDRLVQNTTYLFVAVLFLVQITTGFLLYYPANESLGSLTAALGGLQMVRQLHLFLMWFFVVFAVIHVYMGVAEEFDKVKLMLLNVADEKE